MKQLNAWRINHKCVIPDRVDLVVTDSARSELASYHPIGFSQFPDIEEDDD
jgi:hypothetical protein